MKKEKLEIFNRAITHIKRKGVDDLVSWLKTTDFFDAPASTNFHGNFESGLLEHTINVLEYSLLLFNSLVKKKPDLEYLRESVFISALFHDVCKVNCYSKEEKWTKIDGKWKSYLGWVYKDSFPFGHGEKSVYLVSKHLELKNEEALAIRWHMGTYDPGTTIEGPTKWSYSAASDHPLVRLIHCADLMAVGVEQTIDHKNLVS